MANKATNEAEAKKKIQMIENRLDSGEDFASVAMNFSEQPETAQNGGDLGFIPESSLKSDKTAFEAISKLKPGQYSNVLVVADPNSHQIFGYRVVRLISKEAAGQRELKDPRVQQAVREQLRDRREQLLKVLGELEPHQSTRSLMLHAFAGEQHMAKQGFGRGMALVGRHGC